MIGRRPLTLAMAAALSFVAGSGCAKVEAPLPIPPHTAPLIMSDYRFDVPAQIPAGRLVFRIANSGKVLHRFLLVPMAPGSAPAVEQAKGRLGSLPGTIASSPSYPPGAKAGMAVDLTPGRFALYCVILDDDGRFHFQKGMVAEFRAR